jgi:hypothetical protein
MMSGSWLRWQNPSLPVGLGLHLRRTGFPLLARWLRDAFAGHDNEWMVVR